MTLNEAAAREMADIEYLDEHAGERVFLQGDDIIHRKSVDVNISTEGDDIHFTSDRCPRCGPLVACQRCLNIVETARDDGIDAVDLDKERRLVA
jgi:hypothetical protein